MPDRKREEVRRTAVRKAALALDKLVPGWHRKLNPERLKMSDCGLCALGQLFGEDVETSIARELYPELWTEKRGNDGFHTALWGAGGFDYDRGMLAALIDQLSEAEREALSGWSPWNVVAFGMSEELKCFWAEEVAERVAADGKSSKEGGSEAA